MITYGIAKSDNDLYEILELQRFNLQDSISQEELKQEGFVTVKHDFDLLKRMNNPFPHIVARQADRIIGYTLVMLKQFATEIPVLVPMFEQLNKLEYNGRSLKEESYFVMGQVCIAKPYRGQQVFGGLYQELKNRMQGSFKYCITEISKRNPRSLKAHYKIGFETIHEFTSPDDEEWDIVLLNMR